MIGYQVLGKTFYRDKDPQWSKIDEVSFTILDPTYGKGDITSLMKQYSVIDYRFDTQEYIAGNDYTLVGPTVSKGTFYVKIHSCGTTPGFTVKGTQILLDGKPFIAAGFNAYWMGMHESRTYPTKAQIDNIFSIAVKMKANTIRSHTLGFSSGLANSLQNTNAAFDIIDYAYFKAKETGVKLIIPFTDSYNYYHGNYGDWTDNNKNAFFTEQVYIDRFKGYIKRYLEHVNPYTKTAIKDAKEVLCFELGNELGNYRPQNSSVVTPTIDWLTQILWHFRSLTDTLIMDCCDECVFVINSFNVPFDIFSGHFYWDERDRLNRLLGIGAPIILGELGTNLSESYIRSVEKMVQGSIMWGIYPDGLTHNDGFTLNWGDPKLLIWSNHFRRLQGLPEVARLD